MSALLDAAWAWYNAGCNIYPPAEDGSKRPAGRWEEWQHERQTVEWVNRIYATPRAGVGIICGKISGDLEMLELEGRATTSDHFTRISEECDKRQVLDVLERLLQDGYAEWTPSGGLHLLYRIADHDVPGNTKIARRPATAQELEDNPSDKIKVLSETRGEGGYVIVAPTHGTVHPSGDSWSVASGQLGVIPTITWEQRQRLTEAVHAALDEMPAPVTPTPARPHPAALLSGRPGDDYANQVTWKEILAPHGWRIHHETLHETFWTRPGKARADGWSATTGYAGDADRLYVWSTSTVFESEKPYNKFSAYALLEHNGNYAAAARTLAGQGYGQPARTADYVAGTLPPATQANSVVPMRMPSASEVAAASATPAQLALRDDHRRDWQPPAIPAHTFIAANNTYVGAKNVFARLYEDSFKYCAEKKKWLFWTGKVWREDNKDRFEDAVCLMLEEGHRQAQDALSREDPAAADLHKWVRSMSRSSAPSMARWARSDHRIAVEATDLDAAHHLITLNNGVVDLDGLSFQPQHDPKMLLTKQLPVKYDKDASADRWDTFLREVLPDEAVRGYVQRAVGLTLLGDSEQRALFLLHGPSGTGKSQFVRMMELMFGDYAETASSTTFNASSKTATLTNDLNDLRGKRFVSVSELDEGELFNEALVKRLTGGDSAKSRGLYQENKTWRVQFMLWMASNHLPRLNSDDNAIWRRVKPIAFSNVIAEQAGGEIVNVAEKIFAEEASGILNWMLEGVRLYQEHGLDDLPQIVEAVAAYRHDVDVVAQFVEAATDELLVIQDDTAQIPIRNLHAMFVDWCARNGNRRPLGERRFGQRMESLGFARRKTATANVWTGIGVGHHGFAGTMAVRQ
jgi:putative DNA primase/helicase